MLIYIMPCLLAYLTDLYLEANWTRLRNWAPSFPSQNNIKAECPELLPLVVEQEDLVENLAVDSLQPDWKWRRNPYTCELCWSLAMAFPEKRPNLHWSIQHLRDTWCSDVTSRCSDLYYMNGQSNGPPRWQSVLTCVHSICVFIAAKWRIDILIIVNVSVFPQKILRALC